MVMYGCLMWTPASNPMQQTDTGFIAMMDGFGLQGMIGDGQHSTMDAGLSLTDVDGVFCATSQARTSAMTLVEYLGLPDAYTDSTIVGGSPLEIQLAHG